MARFTFSLQSVLRQRELVEQDRQRALAAVQRSYDEMEQALQQMDQTVQEATQDLREKHLTGWVSADYLAAHHRFTLAMQRKAQDHSGRMAETRKTVEAARAELVEAAKQRKAMEKLRERLLRAWIDDQNRRDSAAADEGAQQTGMQVVRSAAGVETQSRGCAGVAWLHPD